HRNVGRGQNKRRFGSRRCAGDIGLTTSHRSARGFRGESPIVAVAAERFTESFLRAMEPLPCDNRGRSELIRQFLGRQLPLATDYLDDFAVAVAKFAADQAFLDAFDLR